MEFRKRQSSAILLYILESQQVPGRRAPHAYLLSTTVQLVVGLLDFGSIAALNAFIGVSVLCLGSSYALPVAILLVNSRKESKERNSTWER